MGAGLRREEASDEEDRRLVVTREDSGVKRPTPPPALPGFDAPVCTSPICSELATTLLAWASYAPMPYCRACADRVKGYSEHWREVLER